MLLLHIELPAYYDGCDGGHDHEALRVMKSIPHPKRELLKLCARVGYTPH